VGTNKEKAQEDKIYEGRKKEKEKKWVGSENSRAV
jgi:hypothetical protein